MGRGLTMNKDDNVWGFRQAALRILKDYSTDAPADKVPEWMLDLQRLTPYGVCKDATTLIETFRAADRVLKTAPLDVRARLAFFGECDATLYGADNGMSKETWEEFFCRRDELLKDNYFRTVFVHHYICKKIYTRFFKPIYEKAEREGRLPKHDGSIAAEIAYDEFDRAFNLNRIQLFEQLAAEYGEVHICQGDKHLEADYVPLELKNAVLKVRQQWEGPATGELRKGDVITWSNTEISSN